MLCVFVDHRGGAGGSGGRWYPCNTLMFQASIITCTDFSYSIYIYTYTKKSGWSLPGQPKCIRQVPPPVATFWREQTASTSFTTHKVIKYQFSLQHVVCSEWQRWQQPTTTTTAGNGLGMFPKDVSLWLIDDFTPIQPCLLLIPTNGMVLCHWTFTCLKDIK